MSQPSTPQPWDEQTRSTTPPTGQAPDVPAPGAYAPAAAPGGYGYVTGAAPSRTKGAWGGSVVLTGIIGIVAVLLANLVLQWYQDPRLIYGWSAFPALYPLLFWVSAVPIVAVVLAGLRWPAVPLVGAGFWIALNVLLGVTRLGWRVLGTSSAPDWLVRAVLSPTYTSITILAAGVVAYVLRRKLVAAREAAVAAPVRSRL